MRVLSRRQGSLTKGVLVPHDTNRPCEPISHPQQHNYYCHSLQCFCLLKPPSGNTQMAPLQQQAPASLSTSINTQSMDSNQPHQWCAIYLRLLKQPYRTCYVLAWTYTVSRLWDNFTSGLLSLVRSTNEASHPQPNIITHRYTVLVPKEPWEC